MHKTNSLLIKKNVLCLWFLLGIFLFNIPITALSADSSTSSEIIIFSEDFEGVFPDDNDWTITDLESLGGLDLWDKTDYRANSGEHSAWCAQTGERSGWIRFFKEDFESSFGNGTNGWSIGDDNPGGVDTYWEKVDYNFGGEGTGSGNYKVYCAGIGYFQTPSGPRYRDEMDAYMSRTLNLTDYSDAMITFMYQFISESEYNDYGQILVNGLEIRRFDSEVTSWTLESIDLGSYAGDVVEITFNFHSDEDFEDEGWYIDDIAFYGNLVDSTANSNVNNYDNDMEAVLVNQIDLNDFVSANLTYYYWIDIESPFDNFFVEISNNGIIWDTEKSYTGNSFGWQFDTINLTSSIGSDLYIKFVFNSDGVGSDYEGAYIDDVLITAVPQNDADSGDDAGDYFETATRILSGSYEGFADSFDKKDYYTIFVSEGNTINVNMTPSSSDNFDLFLYDYTQNLLVKSNLSGGMVDSLSYSVDNSEDYFILVSYINGGSIYQLDINIEDHAPPSLSIISPTKGSELRSSKVVVTWTGSDSDAGIDRYEIRLDGNIWIDVSKATSYEFFGVIDGSHTLHVKAFDQADNSKEVIHNFTVNTSIILGPGWVDDLAIFGTIGFISIILIIYLLKRLL